MAAAALLSASLTLNVVSEPVGAHPPVSVVSSTVLAPSARLDGAIVLALPLWRDEAAPGSTAELGSREPGVASLPGTSLDGDVAAVRRLSGAGLLVGLSRLSASDLTSFVAEFPAQVDSLLAVPPAAAEVTDWWSGLDVGARTALHGAAPRLVGNLDGIPFRERGRANARLLSRSLSEVEARLADLADLADSGQREALSRERAVLTQVKAALKPSAGGPRRSLILLDSVAGGRAAIALGNPDTADFVSYLVPGMNYGVEPQIVNWTATAEALYDEQRRVLDERASTGLVAPSARIAAVAWIGYEAPDLFSVGGQGHAVVGADFLEKYAQGIRSNRATNQPFLSVFAHSYGSTVTLTALSRGSFEVDALVLVGSPGSQTQSVDLLGVSRGNVHVGKADWDPAVDSAFFGSDPGARSYGAHPLGVSGAHDRLTGRDLAGSLGHNAYFDVGSESLHNMALIGTDNAEWVTNGSE